MKVQILEHRENFLSVLILFKKIDFNDFCFYKLKRYYKHHRNFDQITKRVNRFDGLDLIDFVHCYDFINENNFI